MEPRDAYIGFSGFNWLKSPTDNDGITDVMLQLTASLDLAGREMPYLLYAITLNV